MKTTILGVVLAMGLAARLPGRELIVHLDDEGDFTDIHAALDEARDGDTVLLMPGEYRVTRPISFLGKAIRVKGEGGPAETVIRPDDDYHGPVFVFESEGEGAVLEGVTVTGGRVGPDIRSSAGGGIVVSAAAPGISNCIIVGNSNACDGGGVVCKSGAAPTFTDCTIIENTSSRTSLCDGKGSAIQSVDSSPLFLACTIARNEVFDLPGWVQQQYAAIYCSGGAPEFEECVISDNPGGAVHCERDSNAMFTDCVLTRNTGPRPVIGLERSSAQLVNCTISGNSAYSGSTIVAGPSVTIHDSILWFNGPLEIASAEVNYSCVEGLAPPAGTGNINANPLFCGWGESEVFVESQAQFVEALASFRFQLSTNSPCVGTGERGDMGADLGVCDAPGPEIRRIELAPGRYGMPVVNVIQGASIEGPDEGDSIIEGTVLGLRSGAALSNLEIIGGMRGGVVVLGSDEPEIRSCRISGGVGPGVSCRDESAPTIVECTISGNAGNGVSSSGNSAPQMRDSTIEGNAENGLECSGNSAPELESCVISGNVYGILSFGDATPTLLRCAVTKNFFATTLRDRSSARLLQCSFSETTRTALFTTADARAVIANCTISRNGRGGIACRESSSIDMTNCTVAGNARSQRHVKAIRCGASIRVKVPHSTVTLPVWLPRISIRQAPSGRRSAEVAIGVAIPPPNQCIQACGSVSACHNVWMSASKTRRIISEVASGFSISGAFMCRCPSGGPGRRRARRSAGSRRPGCAAARRWPRRAGRC